MTEFPDTQSALLVAIRTPENREAWEEFVLVYRPVIYRMARRRGMQDADAQDLAQNVLIRVSGAIERWEKTEADTRFRHWLRRVARNAILTALSRSPKDVASGDSAVRDLLAEQPEANPDVERELALETMREQYLRAAAIVRGDVNSETWQAFELTAIQGKSCDEASELLGKSVGVIYAARSRIVRRLSDQIQQMEQNEL